MTIGMVQRFIRVALVVGVVVVALGLSAIQWGDLESAPQSIGPVLALCTFASFGLMALRNKQFDWASWSILAVSCIAGSIGATSVIWPSFGAMQFTGMLFVLGSLGGIGHTLGPEVFKRP